MFSQAAQFYIGASNLEQVIEWHGKPAVMRCGKCTEHISGALQTWAERQGIACRGKERAKFRSPNGLD